jgi:sigma-B regulation protein RsbU (phosphoserine phosphatase)
LAGDALGLYLIDDRYLAAYVIDVAGHGVPAALLSVTAMHYLEPEPENASLLRDKARSGGMGSVQRPSIVATELNRRFSADNSDNRFLTMVLCVLDTLEGRLMVASAGHPLPLVLRGQNLVPVADISGLPIAVFGEAEYQDLTVQLQPGDRVYLLSDGVVEQVSPADGEAFGQDRLTHLLAADHARDLDQVVTHGIDALAAWAGERRFTDDVSLVALEWIE